MRTLVFGTGPIALDARGNELRSLLGDLLSISLRVPVEVRPALTYSELLAWVGRREVQLAWLGPALFVQAQSRFGVQPLVQAERRGHAGFRGALFVREDSSIREPEELSGASIAWVDPDSCAGYLFPRIALAQRGLDPDALFGEQRMLGSHLAVAGAVASKQVVAGATYVQLAQDGDDAAPLGGFSGAEVPMRMILTTDAIPGDVIAATREITAESLPVISKSLSLLHEASGGAEIATELFMIERFAPVQAEGYDGVRDAIRAAGMILE